MISSTSDSTNLSSWYQPSRYLQTSGLQCPECKMYLIKKCIKMWFKNILSTCSPDTSTAVDNYRRSQCVPLPGRGHVQHQLCLLLSHALQQEHDQQLLLASWSHLKELKHGQSRVRSAIVGPGGELEVADLPLLSGEGVGHLQVSHNKVLIVLYILWQNVVHAMGYITS